MPSTFSDIVDGVSTSLAIKAPVKVVTNAHLALSGLVVVNGTQTTDGMRVLVKDQNDPVDNGIYNASVNAWRRAKDFDGRRDVVQGTAVFHATTGVLYKVTTADPIVIGESEIEWQAIIVTFDGPLDTALHLSQFGGVTGTNISDALGLLSAAVNALDGCDVVIDPGDYTVGEQDFAGAGGLGYAYRAHDLLYIHDCSRPVRISGYGARLKMANGLKFGTFDPVTGLETTIGSPYTDANYRADPGRIINLENNANVTVEGLELDGNISGLDIGGPWGTASSYQVIAHGIWAYNNDLLHIRNVHSHHNGTDGLIIGYVGKAVGDQPSPTLLENVRNEYNGRQGLSWTGGIGLTAIGCTFNYTGQENPGSFESNPGCGIDIEAEGAVCRRGRFVDCEIVHNKGAGMVAETGDGEDFIFENCLFWGIDNFSIWPNSPGITFRNCRIFGSGVNTYISATNRYEATKFYDCLFEDREHPVHGPAYVFAGVAHSFAGFPYGVMENCTIKASTAQMILMQGSNRATQCIIRGCTFISTYDGLADQSYQATLGWCHLENNYFAATYSSPPATAYYINFGAGVELGHDNYFASNKLLGGAPTVAGGGLYLQAGERRADGPTRNRPLKNVLCGLAMTDLPDRYGEESAQIIMKGGSAPVAETWRDGDTIINNAPAAGGPWGWVCVSPGTPGTWKVIATIES